MIEHENNIYYKYYGRVYFTRVHLIRVYIHRVLMAASKWHKIRISATEIM